jgi:pimeloyl-ACP methyl ester carboxylesterase
MFYNAKERKIKVNGREIDYISFGRGEKVMLMIQGLNTRGIKGAAIPLAYTYRVFAKEYTVYLFDRRPDAADGITVRELARDVADAMDALGLRNADVLGVSEGGMIAQYLAIDRPDLVNRLVLAVTLARNNETVISVIERWIELTKKGDMRTLVTDMAEKMYSDRYVKRYKPFLPLLAILQKPKDPALFITLARSCLTCDSYHELHKIKCPTLAIGGSEDKVVGSHAIAEIAEVMGCDMYLYDGLGHAAYEEAKDFNTRVLEFFGKNN